MFAVSHTLVDQRYILAAIYGARLAKRSGHKVDSTYDTDSGELRIGPNDAALCSQLVRAAHGEDKLLRAIPVSVFITAPLRWWIEMDTYKVGTVRQSSSLMNHFVSRGELTAHDFTPTTDAQMIELANDKYRKWVASGAKASSACIEWEQFQDAIGRGYLYTSQWYAGYGVVRNVFRQRSGHRQREWREFCDWVKTLPFAGLLLTS